MTAGAIAVPTIIPLRAPTPGQHKTCIDSNTKIELRSGLSLQYAISRIPSVELKWILLSQYVVGVLCYC